MTLSTDSDCGGSRQSDCITSSLTSSAALSTSRWEETSASSSQTLLLDSLVQSPLAVFESTDGHINMWKRHSLSRSSSDAPNFKRTSITHGTNISSQTDEVYHPPRPATSLSTTRTKKSEPFESIRNSIFGGRKRVRSQSSPVDSPLSPSHRNSFANEPLGPCEEFDPEDEYHHYLRKLSISPPFDFQHLTQNTGRKQLPPLETVNEQDFSADFWATAAQSTSLYETDDVEAEDQYEDSPALGTGRGARDSRPLSPVPGEFRRETFNDIRSSIGGHGIYDSMPSDGFQPHDRHRLSHLSQSSRRSNSHRYSSHRASLGLQQQQPRLSSYMSSFPTPPRTSPAILESAEPFDDPTQNRNSNQFKQPIPHMSPQTGVKNSLAPSSSRSSGSIASFFSSDHYSSSTPSRHSSQSTSRSLRSSFTPAVGVARLSGLLPDATWEEDVDFSYQQEAESTCNFDWYNPVKNRVAPLLRNEGGPQRPLPIAPSPTLRTLSSEQTRQPSFSSDLTQENASPSLSSYTQGPSVGHRGFLAARSSETSQSNTPVPSPGLLGYTAHSAGLGVPSPGFSVGSADEENIRTPLSPANVHFRDFDSVSAHHHHRRPSAEFWSEQSDSIRILPKPGAYGNLCPVVAVS